MFPRYAKRSRNAWTVLQPVWFPMTGESVYNYWALDEQVRTHHVKR